MSPGKRRGVTWAALLIGGLALAADRHFEDPLAAARTKARELGVDLASAEEVGGRYGSRVFSSYGAVDLLEDVGTRVNVEVERIPFGRWRLVTFSRRPAR